MNESYIDLNGEIYIKSPSNRMEGRFILYRQEESFVESELRVTLRQPSIIESTIEVRVQKPSFLNTSINIMYGDTSELASSVMATSVNAIDAELYVPPHNRILGSFELLAAPRVTADLPPVADATTRSRIDKQIINYGNTQSMLIGNSPEGEQFETFIDFGDIASRLTDINKLEEAKMRLYYSGSFQDDTDVTLWQPSSIWREYGITYVNRPSAIELLSDEYTINRTKYYIEIDILKIVKDWINGDRINYGLIIQSDSSHATYFNTRESDRSPVLHLKYITTDNYSIGRAEVNSSINIIGVGHSEIRSILNVKSNVGFKHLDATLSVHRPEDIIDYGIDSTLCISRPSLYGRINVVFADSSKIDSNILVMYSDLDDKSANLTISRPNLFGHLTVSKYTRANQHLDSTLTVNVPSDTEMAGKLIVVKPYMQGFIGVRSLGLDGELDSQLDVPNSSSLPASIVIARPEMFGYLTVSEYTAANESLDSVIAVTQMEHDDLASTLLIGRPSLYGYINVKYADTLDSELYVKDYDYVESLIDVRQKSDLNSQLIAKIGSSIDSEIVISRPELFGYLYPRVIGNTSVDSYALFRQLDVVDLSATILIKGRGSGFYFYIM